MKNIKVLIISLILVYFVAFIGSLFTSADSQYYKEIKPNITPPNYVFPIVWNILYFLIAISLYLTWINAKKQEKSKTALIFAINLILNAFWTFLYFTLKNPLAAFIDIIFIWITIILMIRITYKINKTASYLLIPYLLWVSFAIILNYLSI